MIWSSTNNLKTSKTTRLILPNFKTNCKTVLIKKVWYWCKNRQIDQWNRIASPDVHPYMYMVNWFFNKMQGQLSGRKIIFSTNVAGTMNIYIQRKKKNSVHTLYHISTLNSKFIININIKYKPKLHEENVRKESLWSWARQWFLSCTPKTWFIKIKVRTWI